MPSQVFTGPEGERVVKVSYRFGGPVHRRVEVSECGCVRVYGAPGPAIPAGCVVVSCDECERIAEANE